MINFSRGSTGHGHTIDKTHAGAGSQQGADLDTFLEASQLTKIFCVLKFSQFCDDEMSDVFVVSRPPDHLSRLHNVSFKCQWIVSSELLSNCQSSELLSTCRIVLVYAAVYFTSMKMLSYCSFPEFLIY